MKTFGVIPARGGSKGIPRKNLVPINGKPLIQYTIEAALDSNINEVVVSSDDDEILELSAKLGAKPLLRPAHLAQDNTPSLPVIQHAFGSASSHFDAVLTLQPTSPLRTFRHINEAIELFGQYEDANSLVSVMKVPHNMVPESIMTLNESNFLIPYSKDKQPLRRQDKPTYYARNGAAIYITRNLSLQHYIFGGNTLIYEMSREESLDLDEKEDIPLIEYWLSNR
ncbi:cytidylyltransferase domain-containing protein [Roseivirga pacifica]|uniref:acylneuraminate cytidylyltransferase family protein n=1 Tax=Roseivirga pacifica TaxID=1267423 RepID=UPI00227A2BAD|nr:acylneuraminate cytidylyltransferase family protein [Roseivirga pacifica]